MIYVGDVGTILDIVLTGETITGATSYTTFLRKPVSKEVATLTAAVEGSDTIRYTTVADDINEPGTWKIQGYIDDLNGWSGHTTIGEFEVEPPLG